MKSGKTKLFTPRVDLDFDVSQVDQINYMSTMHGHLMVCLCEKSCNARYLNAERLVEFCQARGINGITLSYQDADGEIKS